MEGPVHPPSILFPPDEPRPALSTDPPPCVSDLFLDQVVDAVLAGREAYDLKPFFYTPLRSPSAVMYRQQVMRDLEDPHVYARIASFAAAMQAVREHLAHAETTFYVRQRERWFLDAAYRYCEAIQQLAEDLSRARIRSAGLVAFRDYLERSVASAAFWQLHAEAVRLLQELSAIRYTVLIRGLRVEVRPYAGEPDYSAEIVAAFERFRQADVPGSAFTFRDSPEMNHVEAQILDGVARLHPEVFSRLAAFRRAHRSFPDPVVVAFDREVQFYLSYLAYIAPLQQAGLPFCYPEITEKPGRIYARNCYDLALAQKLVREGTVPVCNDFELTGPERMLVVTGSNQGGKTTFARSIGQLHHLAALGCPVPGTQARLLLTDRIFTHFERGEPALHQTGKLEDDLLRIRRILENATPHSLLILNEPFSSTSLHDALFLSERIATAVLDRGALCVWVTFLDELASLNAQTVSMVATVDPQNPEVRTFRIERRPADGLAYAVALARKHRLTEDQIRERLRHESPAPLS
ncbi:MAG: DNA mismatch repair protein MutS [Armatimonadota bacterium]|nr:DNA mismatch repair protein MutS [Armatimonadota bacterium]MDR7443041.1 DNA mismatch repair protein MutS [Armatimonadota bacterium]MDR7569356.1 DNA mismatch repair protein MutS [Armatimonadota bacterium]MDR7614505.1 DNA mismatch repair protein MutS [Armatimonadota bacterium]